MKNVKILFSINLLLITTLHFALSCGGDDPPQIPPKETTTSSLIQPVTSLSTTTTTTQIVTTTTTAIATTTTTETSTTTTSTTTTWNYDLNWVNIPGGTFLMGKGPWPDSTELIPHTVVVSDFSILDSEVTNEQYCEFLNAVETTSTDVAGTSLEGRWNIAMELNSTQSGIQRTGTSGNYSYSVIPGREYYPVYYITYTNAGDYCDWLGGTLPSEAQWEYAAGGPNHYLYSLSNTYSCNDYCCSVSPCPSNSGPCMVKSYPPNGYGIYDMSGNSTEFVIDAGGQNSTGTSYSDKTFFQNCYDAGVVVDPVNTYGYSTQGLKLKSNYYGVGGSNGLACTLHHQHPLETSSSQMSFRCIMQ